MLTLCRMDDGQALLKDINVTGCYRSLTVEFDLLHLAYNTLIESSHLAQEAEGSAFKLLRALVCQWHAPPFCTASALTLARVGRTRPPLRATFTPTC